MILQNELIFCTLFDSNYLDKGLALYQSMKRNMSNFKLYVFAFDEKCFETLAEMQLKHITLLSVEDIMTNRLQEIKAERTNAEFCWTCTPLILEYVLLKCNEPICTYIDADIYFFANPKKIIQEILEHNCSVGLVKHGFERNWDYGRQVFELGKYCIQFNTFLNIKESIQVLMEWKEQCLSWCYNRIEDRKLGDQKYPDKWRQKYSFIYESTNLGAGVAPWNLHLYSYEKSKGKKIWMKYRGKEFYIIFYHFEGMRYLENNKVYLRLWNFYGKENKKKIKLLYGIYFKDIVSIRQYLKKKYEITFEHMHIDKKEFVKNYSLINSCIENGVLDGLKNWIKFQKNNIVIVDRIVCK